MTRVLLLTFDRLPNRQLAGDDAALTQAYEGLDAVSACLENHYLQQPGAASIAASPDWATLRQTLHSSRVELQLRLDESSRLRLEEAEPAAATVTPEQVTRLVAETSQEPVLRWIHTTLPTDDEHAAARFAALTQAVATGHWTCAMITSLSGDQAPQSMRFQTACFESLIKVPLWITGKDADARRIQAVTGSFDIAVTLCGLFGQAPDRQQPTHRVAPPTVDASAEMTNSPAVGDEDPQDKHIPMQLNAPNCLLSAVSAPGQPSDRSLLIEFPTARAIRSWSFLFVVPLESPSARSRLYAKPDDCWNVNDVSAEYLQQTQDFERLLESTDC